MLHRMALSNQCLNTFLDFAMYHRLYPVSADSVKSLETSGTSTALRRYAHFYHLSVSIDCACDWGEINLNLLLSSMDELEREYSYVGLSACTWSEFKRSIIHQILLGAIRDMVDRLDNSVSDSVTSDRYTSEIENLLKVYQHYYYDNETDSLHTSYGILRESLLEGVMDKDELNCDRVRRLLDRHPLEAFKLKVIQFLRLVEDKALPIPKTLVCNYELPEIVQRYSDNTSKPLIGASEDTREKRKVVLPVAGMKDIGSSQPSACAAVADAGAPSGVETSSNHDAGDSKKLSESYKEMVQRNLQMVERRKERRDMILAYKEGDSIDPFLPTALATGTLSATDAATVKYFPQFIEMQRRQLLGEPSWWSFLKEGEDKYIAEARDLAEFEKAEYARVMAPRCKSDQEEDGEEEEEVEGDDVEGDEERKTIYGEEGGG